MTYTTPRRTDVQKAKFAIRWDDGTENYLLKLFPPDNDPTKFRGDSGELGEIRRAMRRYEERGADMLEDERFYKARFRLQHVETEG